MTTAHRAAEHSGFIDSVIRGFGWRLGSDVVGYLPHILIIAIFAAAAIAFGWRWFKTKTRK